MTSPTILDLDLVVVPREATEDMRYAAGWAFHHPTGHVIPVEEALVAGISASPYSTAWDDVRKYVDGLEAQLVAVAGPCSLGVGCEQYGVCYADAHGKPEECGKPSFECEALKDARHIADHDKKLWLAAEARIAELEKRLADAERVIEPFSNVAGEMSARNWQDKQIVISLDNPDASHRVTFRDFRAARAYMEGK